MKKVLISYCLLVVMACKETPQEEKPTCGCESEPIAISEELSGFMVEASPDLWYVRIFDDTDPEIYILILCTLPAEEFREEGLEVIVKGEFKSVCPTQVKPAPDYFDFTVLEIRKK